MNPKQHKVALQLYSDLQATHDRSVEKNNIKVTCTKGCDFCCYQLVLVDILDGILIAKQFLAERPVSERAELFARCKLNRAAFLTAEGKPLDYFVAQVPCALLDTKTNMCGVYESRPAACRWHYVVSDPKLCDGKYNQTNPVGILSSQYYHAATIQEHKKILNELGIPFTLGPIHDVVLLGMSYWIEGPEQLKSLIAASGSPNMPEGLKNLGIIGG